MWRLTIGWERPLDISVCKSPTYHCERENVTWNTFAMHNAYSKQEMITDGLSCEKRKYSTSLKALKITKAFFV